MCPTFIIIISLGCNLFEIGSRPQFYTLCLSPIRIIPLLSDPSLEGCPAPAVFLYMASHMSGAQMEHDRGCNCGNLPKHKWRICL